jgi:hypothetical protein
MPKRIICFLILSMCFNIATGPVFASDSDYDILKQDLADLKQKIAGIGLLQARIAELEARLAQYERAEFGQVCRHENGPTHSHEGKWDTDIGHEHVHVDMENIQIHGGVDLRYVSRQGAKQKVFLHEAELGLGAKLADWLETLITFTKHHGEDVEVEQAWAKLKFDDINLQARLGKFFVNFGPENRAGFFERRTITPSAMREGFFGHDSWTDEGIEVAYLIPLDFQSVITASVLSGDNAKTFGDGENTVSNNNFPIALNLSNKFDIEWGIANLGSSFAYGKWDRSGKYDVYLVGVDAGLSFDNWNFQAEYIYRDKAQAPGAAKLRGYGYYILSAYTYPVKWRYLDNLELLFSFGQSDPDTGTRETRYSPQLTLNLTDGAKIRFLYDIRKERPASTDNNRFIGQFAYHF